MEVPILQSRSHMSHRVVITPTKTTNHIKNNHKNTNNHSSSSSNNNNKPLITSSSSSDPTITMIANITKLNYLKNFTLTPENITWINPDLVYFNSTTNTTNEFDYDFQTVTANTTAGDGNSWQLCKEWTPAQHPLFQTANFFFAAAFLVPNSFKQSVLIVRALLSIGYMFSMVWGGVEVCAPDILLWNFLLVAINLTHTALLTWKFLPPTLTLELTELYLKVFKPLRVSRKHFKELVKEAKVMSLERGDIYAVEDVSPADERLSILLKGKLRVTCDDTHLHFINVHQFVDSPEWEQNHEQSDDVFQVTITAEEDSVYLYWPRMKLERVLRHRPSLKVVFDAIIGKDITQKLYALNEHLSGINDERKREHRNELWTKSHHRSMSMDAVNTGTTGLVRSQAYRAAHRKDSLVNSEMGSLGRLQTQCWVPIVANQFPAQSPFMSSSSNNYRQTTISPPDVTTITTTTQTQTQGGSVSTKNRPVRKSGREVKFDKPIKQLMETEK